MCCEVCNVVLVSGSRLVAITTNENDSDVLDSGDEFDSDEVFEEPEGLPSFELLYFTNRNSSMSEEVEVERSESNKRANRSCMIHGSFVLAALLPRYCYFESARESLVSYSYRSVVHDSE